MPKTRKNHICHYCKNIIPKNSYVITINDGFTWKNSYGFYWVFHKDCYLKWKEENPQSAKVYEENTKGLELLEG